MSEVPVGSNKITVLIVDDSAIFRSYWANLLNKKVDIEVVGVAENGLQAIEKVKLLRPNVVILDIEMPVLDGISAIPLIIAELAQIKILVASSLSIAGSKHTVDALAKGAADFIPKPSALGSEMTVDIIKDELLAKIRALVPNSPQHQPQEKKSSPESQKPILRGEIEAIAIGSSTGGPNALEMLLKSIPIGFPLPILITQHMPTFFITALAERLSKEIGRPCVEPKTGDVVREGHVYLAPGGSHMLFERKSSTILFSLSDGPAENFCKPAVDPMFRSLAQVYGKKLLAAVLTGMGEDGKKGSEEIIKNGGQVIAQDEASSVVWGMPGAIVKAGLATKVLPIDQVGPWLWNTSGFRSV